MQMCIRPIAHMWMRMYAYRWHWCANQCDSVQGDSTTCSGSGQSQHRRHSCGLHPREPEASSRVFAQPDFESSCVVTVDACQRSVLACVQLVSLSAVVWKCYRSAWLCKCLWPNLLTRKPTCTVRPHRAVSWPTPRIISMSLLTWVWCDTMDVMWFYGCDECDVMRCDGCDAMR